MNPATLHTNTHAYNQTAFIYLPSANHITEAQHHYFHRLIITTTAIMPFLARYRHHYHYRNYYHNHHCHTTTTTTRATNNTTTTLIAAIYNHCLPLIHNRSLLRPLTPFQNRLLGLASRHPILRLRQQRRRKVSMAALAASARGRSAQQGFVWRSRGGVLAGVQRYCFKIVCFRVEIAILANLPKQDIYPGMSEYMKASMHETLVCTVVT